MAYNGNPQPSVKRQVVSRIGWKLLIVGLAVGAFFGLNSLQGAKSRYEKKQNAIALVNLAGDSSTAEEATELDYADVKSKLTQVFEASIREAQSKISGAPVAESIKAITKQASNSVNKATTFKDKNELISYLIGEIDRAKGGEEKKLEDDKNKRIQAYENLQINCQNDRQKFLEGLNSTADPALYEELTKPDQGNVQVTGDLSQNTEPMTADSLVKKARDFEDRRHNDEVGGIDYVAFKIYGNLYSRFAKDLGDLIERQRNSGYLAARVLDDKRGEYAIYQAGYLTCVVLLVFGLLYPIYLLLRLLPPFAASLDPLADQGKAIISGRTSASAAASLAAPGIVKTLALSVAAVGIGTAVAVANNGSSPVRNQSPALADVAALAQSLGISNKLKNGGDVESQDGGPPATPTATPPYESKIKELEGRIKKLEDGPEGPGPNLGDLAKAQELKDLRTDFRNLKLDPAKVEKLENGVDRFNSFNDQTSGIDFSSLNERTSDIAKGDATLLKQTLLPQLEKEKGILETKTDDLEKKTKDLEMKATDLETRFFNKLDTANNQILGARDDNFVGSQGSQGRNILTRTKQLFHGERYMVTNQSYRVMENLMCETPVGRSGVITAAMCTNPQARTILAVLREHVGQGPVGQSEFLGWFRNNGFGVDVSSTPWTRALLRYDRLPY
jgi:hypothetical protein